MRGNGFGLCLAAGDKAHLRPADVRAVAQKKSAHACGRSTAAGFGTSKAAARSSAPIWCSGGGSVISCACVFSLRLATAAFVALVSASVSSAQPPAPPTARALKATAAPKIDGKLDDPAWQGAPVIGGFKQREPDEGDDASEPTSVRVVYDQAYLYIGADLRDGAPGDIRASELRRDNTLESDDTFSVLLDTYLFWRFRKAKWL